MSSTEHVLLRFNRAPVMRIGIYIEHGEGNGVGGAELKMAYLASAWSRVHHVDLIHHRPPLTREPAV